MDDNAQFDRMRFPKEGLPAASEAPLNSILASGKSDVSKPPLTIADKRARDRDSEVSVTAERPPVLEAIAIHLRALSSSSYSRTPETVWAKCPRCSDGPPQAVEIRQAEYAL